MAKSPLTACKIRNLYKIFGSNKPLTSKPSKNGLSKTELNEKFGHVLGLKDINIEMPLWLHTVIMGLSGIRKSTLIATSTALIEPTPASSGQRRRTS